MVVVVVVLLLLLLLLVCCLTGMRKYWHVALEMSQVEDELVSATLEYHTLAE